MEGRSPPPGTKPEPPSEGGRHAIFERYSNGFDLRHGGGVERALFHLAKALRERGVTVSWYAQEAFREIPALSAMLERAGPGAIFPLTDSPSFWRATHEIPERLRGRMVRIWHDVGPLVRGPDGIPVCDRHQRGIDGAACASAHAHTGAYAADIVFSEDPWTRCFPKRRRIPWAVDHLPSIDYRDPDGPILMLAGKTQVEYTEQAVEACRAEGVPVRMVFSNWTTLGRKAKAHFTQPAHRRGIEVIESYDLERDHARVFGGCSAAFVLTQYHETFNLLAAESVHFGIPVATYSCAGATLRFASAVADDVPDVLALIRGQGFRALQPVPRPAWGWRDVAAHYIDLLDDIGCGRSGGGDDRTFAQAMRQGRT
jgi:hypothetical protein